MITLEGLSILRYVPSTIRSGISDTAGSSCGITPVILTPAEFAEELRSPVAISLGLTPRTSFFISVVCKNPSTLDTTLAGSSSSSELESCYPFAWITTCPGPNRTPAAIVCSCPPSSNPREISSNARPKPRAKAVNSVPRGLRQRLRQLIFTRRSTLLTVRPYESLLSADNERLARQDRAQILELWRPAREQPDHRRENPAARTKDALPPLLPKRL